MIAWKAEYGYAPTGGNITPSIGFKLENAIVTDKGIYGFPTVFPFSIDKSNSAFSSATRDYNHDFSGSSIENALGSDYYVITMCPFNIYKDNSTYFKENYLFFSSYYAMHPNLNSVLSDIDNGIGSIPFVFCHIKALGRYIVYYAGTSSKITSIFTEEGNYIADADFVMGSGRHRSGGGFFAYLGDNSQDSFLIPSNYRFFGYLLTGKYYTSSFTDTSLNSGLSALFGDFSPPDANIPDNPYEPGGPSGPTDPALPPGTFDDESDTIPDSPLPTLSAANTGFTRIYNPTLSQVQSLARYLWTDESVIETIWNHIKQFFENPMEAIIGFNLVPVPVPDGGTENFALMYIDTGVSMTVAANQFVDLDCGTVELKRYYGSALDQSPYTKVSCFLPYIGTVNLNTDEVMGTTLQVKYRVDIVSGSCVAKIFVDGNCLYQYSGHCAITIPISSADFSSYVSAAISVGKLAAAAITAGAGAAMAAGVTDASQQTNQVVTTTQVTNTSRNPSTGRQITTGTTTTVQTRESPADQSSTQASFSGLSPQNVSNTVGTIMSSKPHIEHSGSFSGNSGYLGVRRPFLIIERPNMCMPANYQALNGFPAMITMELSTCKGFTRVQQVQLTGMGRATNPEQAEIMELLKSGVVL